MNHRFTDQLSLCSAIAIGLAVSTGHPAGLVVAAGMPMACLTPGTRRSAFRNSLGYYGAGLWPMIPALHRYLQYSSSLSVAILIWVVSAVLLSVPWTVAWMPNRRLHYLWRIPLALIAAIIPPLGLIGFISPISGAGYWFPGTGWIGLAATAFVPAILLALRYSSGGDSRIYLRLALAAVIVLALGSRAGTASADATPPAQWEAINTHFGDVSRPFQDFVAAQFIQRRVSNSPARVLIFPEYVVPRWSDATKEFWRRTLVLCRTRGQVLAIGAGIPRREGSSAATTSYDFTGAIEALRLDYNPVSSSRAVVNPRPEPFNNVLLLLGAQSATFYQRIPVPIGMWRPFAEDSVPLRLDGPGVIAIDHQRAAVLICYEQILTYPVLSSMLQHPTVLVGISNSYWFVDTPIPRYQASVFRAWAELFHISSFLAMNS